MFAMHACIILILKSMCLFGCAILIVYICRLVIGQCSEVACWYNWESCLSGSKLKVPIGFVAVLLFFNVYLSGLWDLYLEASRVIPYVPYPYVR